MTADVKLSLLPDDGPYYDPGDMQEYARACVAHATAANDAETEALRAEMDRWKSSYNAAIELKGRAFAESDRLAEALRDLRDRVLPAALRYHANGPGYVEEAQEIVTRALAAQPGGDRHG